GDQDAPVYCREGHGADRLGHQAFEVSDGTRLGPGRIFQGAEYQKQAEPDAGQKAGHAQNLGFPAAGAKAGGTLPGRAGLVRAKGDTIMRFSSLALAFTIAAGPALLMPLLTSTAEAVQDQPVTIGGIE